MRNDASLYFESDINFKQALIFHKISLNVRTRYYQIYHFSLYNLKELFYKKIPQD